MSNLLHIKTEQDYSDALEAIENLFVEAEDKIDDPLNDSLYKDDYCHLL